MTAYQQGCQAYYNNQNDRKVPNPHVIGTTQHTDWQAGFEDTREIFQRNREECNTPPAGSKYDPDTLYADR